MFERMRTLRGTLSGIILAAALVPCLLTASYLIERFRTVSQTATVGALEQVAQFLTNDVERDYQLLFATIEQLSSDPDIIYAAYTGAFGAKAQQKLEKIRQIHPSAFGLLIVDALGWPVEVAPTSLELLELDPIAPQLDSFFNDRSGINADVLDIDHGRFVDRIYQLQSRDPQHQIELASDHLFMVLSPLWMSAADKEEMHELVGALVVLIPVHSLLQTAEQRLAYAEDMGISILDVTMNGASVLKTTLDREMLDRHLQLKVPLEVEHTDATIELTLGVERISALQQVEALRTELWAIVVGLIIIFGSAAYIGSRYLVHPIMVVNQLVSSYASGDYSNKSLKLSFRELQQMAYVLEQMAQRIVDDQHQLEQRVKERTFELQNTNEELRHTMEQLKATQTQLVEAEKMSQLGQLVAGVAHEINTPVGVAVTAATLLERQTEDLEHHVEEESLTKRRLQEYVTSTLQTSEMVRSNLQRAANLIRNFKEVAADQSSEHLRKFGLLEYVNSLIKSLQPELKGYQLDIDVDGDETLVLDSYPGAYSQVLTNLIMNSLKHGFYRDKHHHINICFEVHDQQLLLKYRDDGRGIDAVTLPRIFDPFFTTQRTSGGTGLGLHIVYNVVSQKLGGTIEVHSDVGDGVEFIMRMPLPLPQRHDAKLG
ncbi:hypothetical protein GCM10011369_31910 [Neiella marina]|uniref:histidine kinase n=1 Tax=Neiella marina TaxID=508461 RepID=A0A8J2U8X8_9GAMM|nr:ATP-binding protein [Neiella marina]GGA87465.1 hypothetical protein GCM10011369_31910 [Neiella marina]